MKTRPYDGTPSNWVHFMNTKIDSGAYTLSLLSNGLCNPETAREIPRLELAQSLREEIIGFGYLPIWVVSGSGEPAVWNPLNNTLGEPWFGAGYKVGISEVFSENMTVITAGLVDRTLGSGRPWK